MESRLRPNPHMYEINTCVFLERMSREYGRKLTLSTVPDEQWRKLSDSGFDLVWLMGVWQRSPGARRVALLDPALRRIYDEALPGWTEPDVSASPYAIFQYLLDPSLGRSTELAEVRKTLNQLGMALILDFVPNHVALDHPWTLFHPRRLVRGNEALLQVHPDRFFSPDGKAFFAHGRDPNFSPWTDTAQVDFFSSELRRACLQEVLRIAEMADGARCDMAMLALNEVFARTWGEHLGGRHAPESEFWSELIGAVRQSHPGFLFIGEAYWGLEAKLLQLGFDFVYDKGFYDKLRFGAAAEVRSHLLHSPVDNSRCVRFIENHDEPRATIALGRERLPAAAAMLATVPGLRLFHDGQLEGRCVRLPVQLAREPGEPTDMEVSRMYERLLQVCKGSAYHEGEWTLIEAERASDEGESHHSLLIWSWRHGEGLKLVVVNYAGAPARGRVKLPPCVGGGECSIQDEMTGARYRHDSAGLARNALDIDLCPWEARLLHLPIHD